MSVGSSQQNTTKNVPPADTFEAALEQLQLQKSTTEAANYQQASGFQQQLMNLLGGFGTQEIQNLQGAGTPSLPNSTAMAFGLPLTPGSAPSMPQGITGGSGLNLAASPGGGNTIVIGKNGIQGTPASGPALSLPGQPLPAATPTTSSPGLNLSTGGTNTGAPTTAEVAASLANSGLSGIALAQAIARQTQGGGIGAGGPT